MVYVWSRNSQKQNKNKCYVSRGIDLLTAKVVLEIKLAVKAEKPVCDPDR